MLSFTFLLSCAAESSGFSAGEEGVDAWLTHAQEYDPAQDHRRRSVILLHGFGGSPYDMRPLALALRESGFRIVVPVIPEETAVTPVRERGRMSPGEKAGWLAGIVDRERGRYGRKPYLVGFSMGGTLAILAAAEGGVERLVLVAPFFSLPRADRLLARIGRLLSTVMPVLPKPWKGKVNDPEGYRRYRPGLSTVSLRAFRRLRELAADAREALTKLPPIPVLVLASPDDEVASFDETARLFKERPETEFISFPGSNHILFYDYSRAEAIAAVREFLER